MSHTTSSVDLSHSLHNGSRGNLFHLLRLVHFLSVQYRWIYSDSLPPDNFLPSDVPVLVLLHETMRFLSLLRVMSMSNQLSSSEMVSFSLFSLQERFPIVPGKEGWDERVFNPSHPQVFHHQLQWTSLIFVDVVLVLPISIPILYVYHHNLWVIRVWRRNGLPNVRNEETVSCEVIPRVNFYFSPLPRVKRIDVRHIAIPTCEIDEEIGMEEMGVEMRESIG